MWRVSRFVYAKSRWLFCNLTDMLWKPSACFSLCVGMMPKVYHHGCYGNRTWGLKLLNCHESDIPLFLFYSVNGLLILEHPIQHLYIRVQRLPGRTGTLIDAPMPNLLASVHVHTNCLNPTPCSRHYPESTKLALPTD
jgi:hypothetical protein